MGYPRFCSESRWSGLATVRMLLCLSLVAAFILALPRTGYAQALTTLHFFSDAADGANPQAGLIQGSDGCLYGTTWGNRSFPGGGSVFRITTSGTLNTVYALTEDDGSWPNALMQAADGNFYGTYQQCFFMGGDDNGTVFQMSPGGTFSVLFTFAGGS